MGFFIGGDRRHAQVLKHTIPSTSPVISFIHVELGGYEEI